MLKLGRKSVHEELRVCIAWLFGGAWTVWLPCCRSCSRATASIQHMFHFIVIGIQHMFATQTGLFCMNVHTASGDQSTRWPGCLISVPCVQLNKRCMVCVHCMICLLAVIAGMLPPRCSCALTLDGMCCTQISSKNPCFCR